MKSFFALVFMLCAACASASPAASVRPLWLLRAEGLSENQQICTTSSINEKVGLWLTANHCVVHGAVAIEDHSNPDAIFHSANIVWTSEAVDLAVLFTPTLRVPALHLATTFIAEEVQYYGYPAALPVLQHLLGSVAAHDTLILGPDGTDYGIREIFQMPGCQGASGAAILNMQGEIVSVLQLGLTSPCSPLLGGIRLSAFYSLISRFFE